MNVITVLYLQARPATRNARHDGNEPRAREYSSSTLRILQSFKYSLEDIKTKTCSLLGHLCVYFTFVSG